MSIIPSSLARVPDMLVSRISRESLLQTNRSLLRTQLELASGKRVSRPSDDAVASGTIAVLDDVIERRDQRLRNLSHAESVLNTVDAALADVNELLLEAKGIGASQIGIGSDADTRANQASVINALLDELVSIANRQFQDLHFFGGTATGQAPVETLLGGLRYAGEGSGLLTDVGFSTALPITLSADEAFGAL
ncbi:MAG: flagellin N-terminal helical domain-containing protein, partial [Planctomycetota bacterium]